MVAPHPSLIPGPTAPGPKPPAEARARPAPRPDGVGCGPGTHRPRRAPAWPHLVTAALILLAASVVAPAAAAAPGTRVGRAGPDDGAYRPPVDGEIIDHFRAPPTPYAAGNRGLDYRTAPWSPVRSTASGEVIFAGPVAGTLHVTIRHADGLRSSYSFVVDIAVVVGQRVPAGAIVGRTGDVFHFGLRDPAGTYLDPEAFFGRRRVVHLVPGGDDGAGGADGPPARAGGEAPALLGVVRDRLGPLTRAWGAASRLPVDPDALRHRLALLGHYAVELAPLTHERRVAEAIATAWVEQGACTPADRPVPRSAGRRILVEVGGIGSTSDQAAVTRLDATGLGYAPGDVVRFSYAGGRVPALAADSAFADIPAHAYDAADSQRDLLAAGADLRRLIDDVSARAPGVPVDVVAHSQGGVVARAALLDGGSDGGGGPLGSGPPRDLATVTTLGSPHEGANAATALDLVLDDPGAARALDRARRSLGLELDPGLPSGRELSQVSATIARVRAGSWPPSVRLTSIAARGDLVVPAGRTRTGVAAARHTVVPLVGGHAHDELPGAAATTREVALALAGAPPTCRSLAAITADVVTADAIGWATDAAAVTVAGAEWSTPP